MAEKALQTMNQQQAQTQAAALAASAAAAELKAVQDAAAAAADGLLAENNSEHELALTSAREELEAASKTSAVSGDREPCTSTHSTSRVSS